MRRSLLALCCLLGCSEPDCVPYGPTEYELAMAEIVEALPPGVTVGVSMGVVSGASSTAWRLVGPYPCEITSAFCGSQPAEIGTKPDACWVRCVVYEEPTDADRR